MSKVALQKAAAAVAKKPPKTPSGLVSTIKTLLPLLPFIIGEILALDKTGTAKKYAVQLRDWLNQAQLD